MKKLKVLAISDTHNAHEQLTLDLTDVDLIVHAGDFTVSRSVARNFDEAVDFFRWFDGLNVKHKVVIPGNHDTSIYSGSHSNLKSYSFTLLNHESIEIEGVKIFGSPYTPSFGHGWAYNMDRDRLYSLWDDIPEDTQLLLTHGPAKRALDLASRSIHGNEILNEFEAVGDLALLNAIKRVKPAYHVFGHIHEEGGRILKSHDMETTFVNAAVVGLWHEIRNRNGLRFEI